MTFDPYEWSDTAAYRIATRASAGEGERQMSGEEPLEGAAYMGLAMALSVCGCLSCGGLFLLFSAAAFWEPAASILLSGWGIGLSALSALSMVLTVVLLDRAQEGRS